MDTKKFIDCVRIPERLLLSTTLQSPAKMVWIAMHLDTRINPDLRPSKTHIAHLTGLSRTTVYKGITMLKTAGWYADDKYINSYQGRTVAVYLDLFLDTNFSMRARLLHGFLHHYRKQTGMGKQFGYSSLSKLLCMDAKTVRKTVKELKDAGWLETEQANIKSPISFRLRHPMKEYFDVLQARFIRNLTNCNKAGEELMKAILSVVVDSEAYSDNIRIGYMRNKATDALLEFDRFYLKGIACEYNGAQHDIATERYDAQKVEKQKSLDALKKQICAERDITLLVMRAEDLSVDGILRRIGKLLPLRALWSAGPVMHFLDGRCSAYRRNTPKLPAC